MPIGAWGWAGLLALLGLVGGFGAVDQIGGPVAVCAGDGFQRRYLGLKPCPQGCAGAGDDQIPAAPAQLDAGPGQRLGRAGVSAADPGQIQEQFADAGLAPPGELGAQPRNPGPVQLAETAAP